MLHVDCMNCVLGWPLHSCQETWRNTSPGGAC